MRLNTPWKSALLFVGGLAACFGLLALRVLFTGHFSYFFLIRNLLLGLIPLVLASIALGIERQNWRVWGRIWLVVISLLWLLFFPNSSYIFTDFIHLIQRGIDGDNPNARGMDNMLVWYDLLNRSLFAFVGHLIGLASLYVMHHLWKKEFGRWQGWFAVVLSCWAAGYGIFIGRFVRWSSWHLFTRTEQTWQSLAENLGAVDAWLFSSAFAVFLLVSYFFLYVVKKHLFVPKEHP